MLQKVTAYLRHFRNRTTLILVGVVAAIFLIGGYLAYLNLFLGSKSGVLEEVELSFDPEGPYGVLTPRTDGNAMILNLKRTSSYEAINYELAYNAEGIDRGVVGSIDTKEKKGEYSQEILFGTCSRNVCKYDKGVENGTLILRIQKGRVVYKMVTTWHLQRADVALAKLSSGDAHFRYDLVGKKIDLAILGFTIINDLSGAPKLPGDKQILGKVYSLATSSLSGLAEGAVTIELAENPATDSKIARFSEIENKWVELETKIDGSKLSTTAPGDGIFTVFTSGQ